MALKKFQECAFRKTQISERMCFRIRFCRRYVPDQPLSSQKRVTLLPFPVCAFIIGEDSFVITSRLFGIHSCLQCAFQRLVHSSFLESIMLFSSCSKDSFYPASRSRATMELSPHPNDIWVRSLHMSVPWQVAFPIVKDAFLAEFVIRDVRNWFFQKTPLKLINLCLRW
jgi:hypothetical protein